MSDWMAHLPKELHNFPLTEIAIPGSHDSGSYWLSEKEIFMEELLHEV